MGGLREGCWCRGDVVEFAVAACGGGVAGLGLGLGLMAEVGGEDGLCVVGN